MIKGSVRHARCDSSCTQQEGLHVNIVQPEGAEREFAYGSPRTKARSGGENPYHSRINLHGYDLFHLFQQLHGQVSCARTNLQHSVCTLQTRLVHYALHHHRIL